jgi:hypothetical protein
MQYEPSTCLRVDLLRMSCRYCRGGGTDRSVSKKLCYGVQLVELLIGQEHF